MADVKAWGVIRMLEADGWYLVRHVGSHRQYRHPEKKGTVTVAVHRLGDDVKKGTLASIRRQAGLKERK